MSDEEGLGCTNADTSESPIINAALAASPPHFTRFQERTQGKQTQLSRHQMHVASLRCKEQSANVSKAVRQGAQRLAASG